MDATNKEQSAKLLELGLNPETADMYYGYKREKPEPLPYSDAEVKSLCLPCWSLSVLLDFMPEVIKDNNMVRYEFRMGRTYGKYWIKYWNGNFGQLADTYHGESSESFLETAFNMLVWLLEKGHIKNETYGDKRD